MRSDPYRQPKLKISRAFFRRAPLLPATILFFLIGLIFSSNLIAVEWGSFSFPEHPLEGGEILFYEYPLDFKKVDGTHTRAIALYKDPNAPDGMLYLLSIFVNEENTKSFESLMEAYDSGELQTMFINGLRVRESLLNEKIIYDGKKGLKLSVVQEMQKYTDPSAIFSLSVRDFLMIFYDNRIIQAECMTRTKEPDKISLDMLKEEHGKMSQEVCGHFFDSVKFIKE